MNGAGENNRSEKKSRGRQIVFAMVAILALTIVGVASYFTLSSVKKMEMEAAASQEQFAGDPEISSQLQGECQKSAEKISASTALDTIISEYKQHADNCRSVYFVIEKESPFRNEGMYPDLAVDIANLAARTDKVKAVELLNFAKDLEPWEYYMGPVVCDSQAVMEAYLESIQQPQDERVCFKKADYTKQLMAELKNKNFGILPKTLASDDVVWVGLSDSEVGCPEKISAVLKLLHDLAGGADIRLEENQNEDLEAGTISFMYRSKTEDKVILEFEEEDSCLQLTSVLVPSLQTQE